MKSTWVYSFIVIICASAVFSERELHSNSWFSCEGIWQSTFIDTGYCLFYSFAEQESPVNAPSALFHSARMRAVHTFQFQVLAATYDNRVSFGISMRSREGRWDMLLQGDGSIRSLLVDRRLKNDSIISSETIQIPKPCSIDSVNWHTITFLFKDTLVQVICNRSCIAKIPVKKGFDDKVRCGLAAGYGKTYFRNISIVDTLDTFRPVIKKNNLMLLHTTDELDNTNDGIFLSQ